MIDFLPHQFKWNPVSLNQSVHADPQFESLWSDVSYDHTHGRLGADLRLWLFGSSDDVNSWVDVNEQVWIEVHLAPDFSGDLPVEAFFETLNVDQQFQSIEDEAGFSDLSISWKSRPYATSGFPRGSRVYDKVLAEGETTWGVRPFDASPTAPARGTIERRQFRFKDLKGTVRLGVGIQHSVVGQSNDYSYQVRSIADFTLNKVTVHAPKLITVGGHR